MGAELERLRKRALAALEELHPRHDLERLAAVLEAAIDHLDHRQHLSARALARLTEATWSRHETRKEHQRRLVNVLRAMNATGLAVAVLPTLSVAKPRPMVAPPTAVVAAHQAFAAELDCYLPTWLKKKKAETVLLLAVAMRLVSRVGMSRNVLVGVLAGLRRRDIHDGVLSLPVEPLAPNGPRYFFPLPAACADVLQAALQHRPLNRTGEDGGMAFLFLPFVEQGGAEQTDESYTAVLRRRGTAIWGALDQEFRSLLSHRRRKKGHQPEPTLQGFRDFIPAAQGIALGRGAPAAYVNIFESFPLPASSPLTCELLTETARLACGTLHRREARGRGVRRALDNLHPPGPVTMTSAPLSEDWGRRVSNILAGFLQEARELETKRGVVGERHFERLRERRDAILREVEGLAPQGSILHLALLWGYAKLAGVGGKERVAISTVVTYFSRVFNPHLLSREECFDLTDWDDETVDELETAVLSAAEWAEVTEGHFRVAWADFLRFAYDAGMLREITRLPSGGTTAHVVARTEIVTPQEFDFVWRRLIHSTHREQDAAGAAILSIAFYGGLRASEIQGLTLQDVYAVDRELWLYVPAGKTPAARRKIPLHALAPPEICEHLRAWWQRRHDQFRRPRLGKTALFGPPGEVAAYARSQNQDPLIAEVREVLGAGFDLHLLRHSCVSWLLLRLHAACHPDFLERLHHRDAWMFSQPALSALSAVAGGGADAGDDWLFVAKLVGHRDLRTMLLHYSHTVGILHGEVMAKAWSGRPREHAAVR